ncbi:SDR family NAD(P)-dependent oxidoreductase [Streptosporangium jomthongense]|uniref:SDR family NAD(P)-dependent oxidoreductase n=1 Tax=Streptosporangium jomthongense TaxID=1193683 RepID=A0ABV8FEI5_9ACTN
MRGVARRGQSREETAAGHPGIAVHVADLRDPHAPQKVVDASVSLWGGVDVLVNNAGATMVTPLGEATAEASRTCSPSTSPRPACSPGPSCRTCVWPIPTRPG